MAQITWTLQALDDLEAIAEFHEQTSKAYADLLVREIYASDKQLARFPVSGRVVPETNVSTIREVIVRNYRVIYAHIDHESVQILAVRSCKIPLTELPGPSRS